MNYKNLHELIKDILQSLIMKKPDIIIAWEHWTRNLVV